MQMSRLEDDAHINKTVRLRHLMQRRCSALFLFPSSLEPFPRAQAVQNDQKLRMMESLTKLHEDNAKLIAAASNTVGMAGSPSAQVEKVQRAFERQNAELRTQLSEAQATVKQKSAECIELVRFFPATPVMCCACH